MILLNFARSTLSAGFEAVHLLRLNASSCTPVKVKMPNLIPLIDYTTLTISRLMTSTLLFYSG